MIPGNKIRTKQRIGIKFIFDLYKFNNIMSTQGNTLLKSSTSCVAMGVSPSGQSYWFESYCTYNKRYIGCQCVLPLPGNI